MTKYILHGGYMGHDNEQNKKFFSEITKGLKDGDRVLLVGFARNSDEYDRIFKRDKASILNNANGKKLQVIWSSEDNFINQVKESSAIVIEGGDAVQHLIETLRTFPDFLKSLDDKTVAGSSAGAYSLAKYFYSRSEYKIFEGLGAVPVRILCHYDGDLNSLERMKEYPNELELIVLKDYEYKVFEN